MPISELPKIYILTLLILLIVRMTRLTTIIFITTSKVLESPEFCSDIFLTFLMTQSLKQEQNRSYDML